MLADINIKKVFEFHGVELVEKSSQLVGDCFLCGKEKKLYVSEDKNQWDCKSCDEKGNVYSFLKLLIESSKENTTDEEYEELRKDRGLLDKNSLKLWNICKSPFTGHWLIPAYNEKGTIVQIYKYVFDHKKKHYVMYVTPTLRQQILGMHHFVDRKPVIYLTEGVWDGIILWETLLKNNQDKNSIVLSVPGCLTFDERWVVFFQGKKVNILFDNDHRKQIGKNWKEPAGLIGTKKVASYLLSLKKKPPTVKYLKWGEEKDYYDPNLPDGYDLRDELKKRNKVTNRYILFQRLKNLLTDIPEEWKEYKLIENLLVCTQWEELVEEWKKALEWTEGLDRALSVMLACVASTNLQGDQLWCKIIGPASCGKSTLCEALATNSKYILSKSTIRGFHSGFKTDSDGQEDNSLINILRDKTLVTKDGDTLLQSPNLSQILSEARDIYDCTSRTHYRNKVSREYNNVRMTWLLCGTSSLRSIDSSELGERFLDCVIMEEIDDDLEDRILLRVAQRTDKSLSVLASQNTEEQHETTIAKAMQLTGGYITYLRSETEKKAEKIKFESWSLLQCAKLGKFVAHMRARPSVKQDENSEREFGARLVSQLVRLAKCLGIVMNKETIDTEIMRRVTRTAFDTARGVTMDILTLLIQKKSMLAMDIAREINQSEENTKKLLRFLRRIKVVEYRKMEKAGIRQKPKWFITNHMKDLYYSVKEYYQ